MRVKTALLKKPLALLLALIFALSPAKIIVFATGEEDAPVSVDAGELVADNYEGLTDKEKALITSGLVIGDTYTYHVPTEDENLVRVDANKKTVTAYVTVKDGYTWTPSSAALKYEDGEEDIALEISSSGDVYEGTFAYAGNEYSIEVTYTMLISIDEAVQSALVNASYNLNQSLYNMTVLDDSYDYFKTLAQKQGDLNSLIDGSLPMGVTLTTESTIIAIQSLSAQTKKNPGGVYDIQLMLDSYERADSETKYLVENGAALKAKAIETYNYVSAIYADEGINTLIEFLGTNSSTGRKLILLKNILKDLLDGMEEAVDDDWAVLEPENNPVKSGLTTAEYQTLDALAEDASDAEYHDVTIMPELGISVVINAVINRHFVTVNVSAEAIPADLTDSDETSPLDTYSTTIQVKDGADSAQILAAIADSGIEAEALEAWGDVSEDGYVRAADAVPEILEDDLTYNIAYTPKTFSISYGFETDLPASVRYGYNMTLPEDEAEGLVYDYYINGVHYLQGSVIKITGSISIARTEGKPWTVLNKDKITAAVYADELSEAEAELLRSAALISDEVLIRIPTKDDGIVSISVESAGVYTLTAEDFDSGIPGLTWVPVKGSAVAGDGTTLFEFDIVNNAATLTSNEFIGVKIRYELALGDDIISRDEALAALNLPDALANDAKAQIENMEILDELYEDLRKLNKATLTQIRIGINGSDMAEETRNAAMALIENCVNPDSERLYLYEYLTGYRAGGLAYYYRNGNAYGIGEQVRILYENLSIIFNDEDFPQLLEDTGKEEYYDRIGHIVSKLGEFSYTAPDPAIDNASPYLSALETSIRALIDNTRTFDAADKDMILDTVLTVAAPEKSVVTVTVVLQSGTGGTVATASDAVIFSSVAPLGESDIARLNDVEEALVQSLGIDDHYFTNDSVTVSAGETLTDDVTVTLTYVPMQYTSVIYDEDGETVASMIFSFDDPKITLPGCPIENSRYVYTVAGEEVTVNAEPKTYAFTVEQIDGEAYVIITRRTVEINRISASDKDGNNVYKGSDAAEAFARAGKDGMIEVFEETVLTADIELPSSVILTGADKIVFDGHSIIISDKTVQLTSSEINITENVVSGDPDYLLIANESGDNYVYYIRRSVYKIIFNADGTDIATVEYAYGAESVTEPAVPEKEGYTGEWEPYTLNSEEELTVNAVYTRKSVVTVNVIIKDGGGNDVGSLSDSASFSSVAPLTAADIVAINGIVNRLIADLGADTVHYTTTDSLTVSAGDTLTADITVTFTYSPKQYTAVVVDENGETVYTEQFSFDSATITLPACTVEDSRYSYTVCGASVVVDTEPATYTFTTEQIDSGEYASIVRRTVGISRISAYDASGKTVYEGNDLAIALFKAGEGGTAEVLDNLKLNKNIDVIFSQNLTGADRIDFNGYGLIITDTEVKLNVCGASIKDSVLSGNTDYDIQEITSGGSFVYSLKRSVYKIIFAADGEQVAVVTYRYDAVSITEPEVPEKEGYTGVWESYVLGSKEELTVNAVYTEKPAQISVTLSNGQNVYKGGDLAIAFAKAGEGGTITVQRETVVKRDIYMTGSITLIGANRIDFNGHKIIITDKNVQLVSASVSIKNYIESGNPDYGVIETVNGQNYVYSIRRTNYKVIFKADGEEVAAVEYKYGATSIKEPAIPEKEGYTAVWESYELNGDDVITVNAIYTSVKPEYAITVTGADGKVLYTGSDINAVIEEAKAGSTVTVTDTVELEKDATLKTLLNVVGAEHIVFGSYNVILADKNAELKTDKPVKDHIKSGSVYSRVSETGKYVYTLEAYDPQILSAELNTKNSNILGFEFDIAGGVLILDVLDPLSKTDRTKAGNGITADDLLKCLEYSTEYAGQITASLTVNGAALNGTSLVPTGAKLVITADNPDSDYKSVLGCTVVILGDVNKNGRIDSGDAKLMIDHYMGNRKLTGDALIAADVNRNGRVDSGDAVKNTIKYSSPSDYTTSLNKNKKAQ